MTYLEITEQKKKSLKKVKIIAWITACYLLLLFMSISPLSYSVFYVIVLYLLYISLKSTIEKNIIKRHEKQHEFKELLFVTKMSRLSNSHQMIYLLLLPAYCMPMFVFLELADLTNLSSVWLHGGIVISLLMSIVYYFYQYSKYHLLVFEEGFLFNEFPYYYDDVLKYQLIKVKKGGYLLEMNVQKKHLEMHLNDNEYNIFKKKLGQVT